MFGPATSRLVGRTDCARAQPPEERAPRIHWMEDRRSAKESLHPAAAFKPHVVAIPSSVVAHACLS